MCNFCHFRSNEYWMYHRNNKWGDKLSVSWTNFNPTYRDDNENAAYIVSLLFFCESSMFHRNKSQQTMIYAEFYHCLRL